MCREGRGTCFNIDLYRDALCKIGNEKCITNIGTVNSRLAHMPAIRTAAQVPATDSCLRIRIGVSLRNKRTI